MTCVLMAHGRGRTMTLRPMGREDSTDRTLRIGSACATKRAIARGKEAQS